MAKRGITIDEDLEFFFNPFMGGNSSDQNLKPQNYVAIAIIDASLSQQRRAGGLTYKIADSILF